MRRNIVAMLAAAAVLVAGGALGALAQSDPEPADLPTGHRAWLSGHLLDELVADGLITSEQANAISDWLDTRRAERQSERQAVRDEWAAAWADGVLTAEEAQALPFGRRLLAENGPFADAWADGQLTQEEFDALKPHPLRRVPRP